MEKLNRRTKKEIIIKKKEIIVICKVNNEENTKWKKWKQKKINYWSYEINTIKDGKKRLINKIRKSKVYENYQIKKSFLKNEWKLSLEVGFFLIIAKEKISLNSKFEKAYWLKLN